MSAPDIDLAQLAARLLALSPAPARPSGRAPARPYYMVNIQHPVLQALYERYKLHVGCYPGDLLSDVQRTMFELSLFNKAALRELGAYCDREEARAASEKDKAKALCPPDQR